MKEDSRSNCSGTFWLFPFPERSSVRIYIYIYIYIYRVATQCSLSSLELRVQFCLLVCCTYPSSSTVNKEKNLKDQRASLRVDTRETQQICVCVVCARARLSGERREFVCWDLILTLHITELNLLVCFIISCVGLQLHVPLPDRFNLHALDTTHLPSPPPFFFIATSKNRERERNVPVAQNRWCSDMAPLVS